MREECGRQHIVDDVELDPVRAANAVGDGVQLGAYTLAAGLQFGIHNADASGTAGGDGKRRVPQPCRCESELDELRHFHVPDILLDAARPAFLALSVSRSCPKTFSLLSKA